MSSTIIATSSPVANLFTEAGSLRLTVGGVADLLSSMEDKEKIERNTLRAVLKLFPDANIKVLEDGRRCFVSTGVMDKKHALRFYLACDSRIFLRLVYLLKSKLTGEIEVWSQECFAVDKAHALDLLNEYAVTGKASSEAFKSIMS